MKTNDKTTSKGWKKPLACLAVTISCILLCCITLFCTTNQKAQIAEAANNGAETIDDKYIVMKGKTGEVNISNLIKTGMEPIGHANYIYGGGWNEADTGGGIEALTIGVAKSWKDFERKQDKSYTNLIEPLDYTIHKEVIHYGLDCSAYLGWIYFNIFNDGKDHVTYASDMGNELVEKGYATKTYDVDKKEGTLTFTPGDIMTSGGHCWVCLGRCADGSVLTLQSQGVRDETQLDKYEGVSIYGTTTADGSKNSQAIALANEYLDRYYPSFNSKYQKGYSGSYFMTDFSEYTWNSGFDKSGLQNKTAAQVMAALFDETSATVNCAATGTTPTIKINRATVTPNTSTAQKYDESEGTTNTVDITLKVPYTQQFTSIKVNGENYTSKIPASPQALAASFEDGYTYVKFAVEQSDVYSIETATTPATTYGVGKTTWEYGHAAERPEAISHIENATIAVESVSANGATTTEPVYYSSTDWVNDAKNGYGAFPAGATVKVKAVPAAGYQVDSVAAVPTNADAVASDAVAGEGVTADSVAGEGVAGEGVAAVPANLLQNSISGVNDTTTTADTTENNEYTFTSPGGDFKLEVKTSQIANPEPSDPSEPQSSGETAAEPTKSAQTGDAIGEVLFKVFRILL